MSVQFISCTQEDCPMNEGKQCRAPFIFVDENGVCMIQVDGPHDGKAEMEAYVDLRECSCKKCRHWEENAASGAGECGFRADLFFDHGACDEYGKQISEPGFSTTVGE